LASHANDSRTVAAANEEDAGNVTVLNSLDDLVGNRHDSVVAKASRHCANWAVGDVCRDKALHGQSLCKHECLAQRLLSSKKQAPT
jgi:hypothetical protein